VGLLETVGRKWLERHVYEALAEDLGERGDLTCQATVPFELKGRAEVTAKQSGVIAGADWATVCGELTSPPVAWQFFVDDGDKVEKGKIIAEVRGSLRGILICERTALNGLSHFSGIATMASVATTLVKDTKAIVLDTRKTLPGLRLAEKYAVRTGGASNHRLGLYDEILIKENHIQSAGGILEAILACKSWREQHGFSSAQVPIEVEVTDFKELKIALRAQPERILLDNFSVEQLKGAVEITAGRCPLEASGGVNLQNLREIALTGVDRISLGALTHSVKAMDLSLIVRETFE